MQLPELLPVRIQHNLGSVHRLRTSMQPVRIVGPRSSDLCIQPGCCLGTRMQPLDPNNGYETISISLKSKNIFRNIHHHFYIEFLSGLFTNLLYLSCSVHLASSAMLFESPDFCNNTSRVSVDCPLGEVAGNPYAFMLGNETMDCAPGTLFNLTVCTCVHYGMCIVCSGHANCL